MGFDGACVRDPNSYIVSFCEDNGDGPGELLYEQTVSPTYENIGVLYNDDNPLYRFDASLSVPIPISEGWGSALLAMAPLHAGLVGQIRPAAMRIPGSGPAPN